MAENDSPPLSRFLTSSGWTFICEEVKNLVRFLCHFEVNVLSNDLEPIKPWNGIFYCTPTRLLSLDHRSPLKVLIGPWKKVTGCPASHSSSRPWLRSSQTFSSRSLIPPLPPGLWQTVVREWHGTDRLRRALASSLRLTLRAQDGQALHADSAFLQRLLHPADRESVRSPLCQDHNAVLLSACGPLWCVVTQPIIELPFQTADRSLRYRSPSDPRMPQGL